MAPGPDDDVIEDAHTDELADLAEAAGNLEVLTARCGIAERELGYFSLAVTCG